MPACRDSKSRAETEKSAAGIDYLDPEKEIIG